MPTGVPGLSVASPMGRQSVCPVQRRSTKLFSRAILPGMAFESDAPLDRLWQEYGRPFQEWDALTLARWLAQTLGQLEGKAWRLSHPLVGAYRLGAQLAHNRQIWFKRLATPPAAYTESPCCRAPFLPLLTRDVRETGLICQHCNETLVPFDEIANDVRAGLPQLRRDMVAELSGCARDQPAGFARRAAHCPVSA